MQRVDFIDVSHWQGSIDFDEVRRAGVLGVIAKATEGTTYKDANFYNNRDGALAAGLNFASYHYLHTGSADKQMEFYLDVAQPAQGSRVVIDYEELDPEVKLRDLENAVAALLILRPDLQIAVYGASKLTDDVDACDDIEWLTNTSLWAARYSEVNEPTVGKAWPTWSAWQFSDEGQVPGVDGNCDVNEFNGSREACIKWFGPTEVVPIPPPQPPRTIVSINVQASADADISVFVNGEEWEPKT